MPAFATILILIILVILTVWIFWPGRGLIAQHGLSAGNREKIIVEDALKYIFDCAYKKLPCDLNGIAGNLHLSAGKTAFLLEKLQAKGLVNMVDQQFRLTDDGNTYALRVIRVHRIWEKYLSEETGVKAGEWHGSADLKEHHISPEEANALAARIGNPVYDPHGDPIPTAGGELPEHTALPLSHLQSGDIARITHIEDEPPAVYQQLIAQGLYPGQLIHVRDARADRIVMEADGHVLFLTPVLATSISVLRLTEGYQGLQESDKLSMLEPGESAWVKGISPNCVGAQRRRLMDLGLVTGTEVMALFKSASGDPVGYRILGATIGIRKSQADMVWIQKNRENEPAA